MAPFPPTEDMTTQQYSLFASPPRTPSPRPCRAQLLTPPSSGKHRSQHKKREHGRSSAEEPLKVTRRRPRTIETKDNIMQGFRDDPTIKAQIPLHPPKDLLSRVRQESCDRIKHYSSLWHIHSPDVQTSVLVGVLLSIKDRYAVAVDDLLRGLLGLANPCSWTDICRESLGLHGREYVDRPRLDGIGTEIRQRLHGCEYLAGVRAEVLGAEIVAEMERRETGGMVFYGIDGRREVLDIGPLWRR